MPNLNFAGALIFKQLTRIRIHLVSLQRLHRFSLTGRLTQLLNENAAELEEGRSPFSVLAITVMLQRNWPLSRDAGQLSVVEDQLPVERDRQAVPLHDDMESVPLTNRPVRLDLWRDPGVDLGRKRRVGTIAPYLARTNRPAPDVHLRLVPAAEKDPRIGVRDLDQHFPAGIVLLVCPIWENNPGGAVDVGTLLNPPVHQQLEVAVASCGPQVPVAPSLMWVTVDDSLDHLPIPVLGLLDLPAIQVDSVEQRYEAFRHELARFRNGPRLADGRPDGLAARIGHQKKAAKQEQT
jgi:hypothetical protein